MSTVFKKVYWTKMYTELIKSFMRHNEIEANMEAYSKYQVLYKNALIKNIVDF